MKQVFRNGQRRPLPPVFYQAKPDWFPDWTGQTCIIIASGPSASTVDLSSVQGKVKVIAINESWRLAPWADILYSCDDAFWKTKKGVPEFKGMKVSQDRRACARYSEIKYIPCDRTSEDLIFDKYAVGWGGNSGFHSINMAAHFNPKTIILVGFDMQLTGGIHWHGRHPFHMNNPTAKNVDRWRRVVDAAAPVLKARGIHAVNLSHESALVNYPKMSLNEALGDSMRFLMIGPELTDLSEVKNFSGVYAYYLRKELINRNHHLHFVPRPDRNTALDFYRSLDLKSYDHIIALGSRHFERLPKECAKYLNFKIHGVVAQFNDKNIWKPNAPLTFIVKGTNTNNNRVIGWGADPELCRPMQSPTTLRILIDHPDYVPDRGDITESIVKQANNFVLSGIWKKDWNEVEVVRWADGAIIDTTAAVNGFHRLHIPFDQACSEYSKAHVFMLTHPESVGLSTLETAMAGALPLVPEGFMPKELLKTIRYIEYDKVVPWELVLKKIQIDTSREKALRNVWSKVTDRLIAGIKEFKK